MDLASVGKMYGPDRFHHFEENDFIEQVATMQLYCTTAMSLKLASYLAIKVAGRQFYSCTAEYNIIIA